MSVAADLRGLLLRAADELDGLIAGSRVKRGRRLMAAQSLNLPINIPWHLIAVSPDMMVVDSCNERRSVEWKSSLAIYAFEPTVEDLPPELCERQVTYLEVTAAVTGHQPTSDETRRARDAFDYLPPDATDQLDRILREYWACYGVLLKVAVFPHPSARQESTQERIDFAELGVTSPFRLIDRFPEGGDSKDELDLPANLEITFQHSQDRTVISVEATVVYFDAPFPVTMTAFRGDQEVGSQTAGPEIGQEHRLFIEADGIDRVLVHHGNSDHPASLLAFTCVSARRVPTELKDYPHIISFEPKTRDLYQAATETGEILTASASNVKTARLWRTRRHRSLECPWKRLSTPGTNRSPERSKAATRTRGARPARIL